MPLFLSKFVAQIILTLMLFQDESRKKFSNHEDLNAPCIVDPS